MGLDILGCKIVYEMADKIIQKSYKYRILKPSRIVQNNLEQTLRLCRELYNASLQERRDAYRLNRIHLNYFDQANQLKDIKRTREDLKDIYSQVLQDVLRRVDKTFKSFFKRVKQNMRTGFPRFKGENRYNSFTFPQSGFSLTENRLRLSKIGVVKLRLDRKIVGKIKTLTIKREIDKWFAIITVETKPIILHKTNRAVGIDMGISSFLTLSNGEKVPNYKYLEASERKLKVIQRRVSRRKKGSNRRRKAVLQLRKIYRKIRNQRNNFQHQVSTFLVRNYDLIVIEKLNIDGLAKGFLSKQVNDAAWSSFFHKLRYKAENAGKSVIEVNPAGTSQSCSRCRETVKKDLAVRIHKCHKCGLSICRDWNAAINILGLGLSLSDGTYQVAESVSEESSG